MHRLQSKKQLARAIAILTLCLPGLLYAADTVWIVNGDDIQGWSVSDAEGAATVGITDTEPYGIGKGSLEFTTSETQDVINATKAFNYALSRIEEIGYSYFTENGPDAPTLQIEYYDRSALRGGTLSYVPSNQGAVPEDVWVDVPEAHLGVWYDSFSDTSRPTLADWQTALPNADMLRVNVQIGFAWTGSNRAFADLVRLQLSGEEGGNIWDFEYGSLAEAPTAFYPITPCRIVDTQAATDPAYQGPIADETIYFFAKDPQKIESQGGKEGGCGIPFEATSLSLNFTAANNTSGRFTAYPVGARPPTASILNFRGWTVANSTTLQICPVNCYVGDLAVAVTGSSRIVIDALGYFAPVIQ